MNDNREYLTELFNKHYDRLFKYCLAALNSDNQEATDVVGDVFLAAERNAEKLASHPDVVGWLYKTANHLIAKRHRSRSRNKKRSVSFETLFPDMEEGIHGFHFDDYDLLFEQNDISEDNIERIKKEILLELNSREYRLYNAVFVEMKSCSELAKECGVSQDAMRMRVHRLKMKLHRLIQSELKNRDSFREGRHR